MIQEEEARAHILIVDDEEAICRMMTRTLQRNGFDASSVSDPTILEKTLDEGLFQVILLDRCIGAIKGISLLPLIREHAPSAKVLFFTGEVVEGEEYHSVDGVVQKPINGKDLAATLRAVLHPNESAL